MRNNTLIFLSLTLASIACFSLFAADQKITLTATLNDNNGTKSCSVNYTDDSSSSNCSSTDNCTKTGKCICATAGDDIKWKSSRSDDKFKFKVTQIDSFFDTTDDCGKGQLKRSHKCKVSTSATAGSYSYTFTGEFKNDDSTYACSFDPEIIIKSEAR